MKTTGKGLVYFMGVSIIGLSLFACKKDNTTTTANETDTSIASDHNLADATYNDVNNIADQASTGTLVFYSPTYDGNGKIDVASEKSSCATITNDTTATPHVLTIDFGTTNCTCNDGKNRRGQIIVTYTGHYRDAGSTHTITFNNYYVNDNHVEGTKTVTNNGLNTAGNITFSISVDGQITKTNGDVITHVASHTREWTEGSSTLVWNDDVYLITGSSHGTKTTSSGSTNYTAEINTALKRALSCHWFESGVITITPAGHPARIIDYGSGTCDDQAIVTINGTPHTITL